MPTPRATEQQCRDFLSSEGCQLESEFKGLRTRIKVSCKVCSGEFFNTLNALHQRKVQDKVLCVTRELRVGGYDNSSGPGLLSEFKLENARDCRASAAAGTGGRKERIVCGSTNSKKMRPKRLGVTT